MGFAAFSTHQQELFLTDSKVTSESGLGATGLDLLVMMRHGDWEQKASKAPVFQGVILKEEQREKKREKEKKNDTGRPSFGEQGP